VIHTGWHRFYNDTWYPATCGEATPDLPRYFLKQPGPRRPFADWVRRRGIHWMAIDAMSPDHPMDTVVKDVRPDVAEDVMTPLRAALRSGGGMGWAPEWTGGHGANPRRGVSRCPDASTQATTRHLAAAPPLNRNGNASSQTRRFRISSSWAAQVLDVKYTVRK
jgi:DNA-binding transcriptional LysR family regulator